MRVLVFALLLVAAAATAQTPTPPPTTPATAPPALTPPPSTAPGLPAPPTAATTPATPTISPPGVTTPQQYVNTLQQILGTAQPAATTEKAAPKEEGAKAVSVQNDVIWEEDYDEYRRSQALKPKKRGLQEGISEAHVVEPGDTLWDLSARFLNNPWMWPRVWSYNPHVTNPHWIYPGEVIRFRPQAGKVEEPTPIGPKPIPTPTGPPPKPLAFVHAGFIDKGRVKELGKLENSPQEGYFLSRYDDAYVSFKKPRSVRTGDRVLFARIDHDVDHPVTKKPLGHIVLFTGEGTVTARGSEKKFFTVQVGRNWRTIERGNLVFPWRSLYVPLERRPNPRNMDAVIVASIEQALLGQYHLVFLDKGSKDGVGYGNKFTLLRKGDGYLREEEYKANLAKMPVEDVGELTIIGTRPTTSLGVLRKTNYEVEIGAKVRMRKGE